MNQSAKNVSLSYCRHIWYSWNDAKLNFEIKLQINRKCIYTSPIHYQSSTRGIKKGGKPKKTKKKPAKAKQNKQKTHMHIYLKCLMSNIDCDVITCCLMTIYLCSVLKKGQKYTRKIVLVLKPFCEPFQSLQDFITIPMQLLYTKYFYFSRFGLQTVTKGTHESNDRD